MGIKDPQKRSEYNRQYRQKRLDSGICIECPNPREPENSRCTSCIEKTRQATKARRARRKVQGLCIICGKPVLSSRSCCPECIARESDRQRRFRIAVLDHYGRVCACCGEDQVLFLCIDHVSNDGAQHRAEVGTGSKVMEWLVRQGFPDGFQTLCWNCNAGKQFNGGTCPHQLKAAQPAPGSGRSGT